MSNAAEGRRYWTLGRIVHFHVDHSALLAYTNETLITPKLWRRLDTHLRELTMQIEYRPGKEMLADEFTRLTGDQSDGRFRGILLRESQFSPTAWRDLQDRGRTIATPTGDRHHEVSRNEHMDSSS